MSMREIAKLWDSLLRNTSPDPKPGYSINEFGVYEHRATRDALIAAYRRELAIAGNDAQEANALAYSLAGVLKRALELDEARALLTSQIQKKSKLAIPERKMLAGVMAIGGDIDGARNLASELRDLSVSPLWQMNEAELESERKKYQLLSLR